MRLPFPVPPDEVERLAALRRYEILDTFPEEAFDRVTQLAASMFAVPFALITFIDADRQWFKSRVGIPISQVPRAVAFCTHAILSDSVCLVPDTRLDPRFRENPAVVDQPLIRFYVGAPLITRDGYRVGSLCLMDQRPRPEFSLEEQHRLETLARMIMSELDLRVELSARARAERDLKLVSNLILAITEAPSVNTAMETSLGIICEAVGAARGRAWTLLAHGDPCQLIAAWGLAGGESVERLNQLTSVPLTAANSVVGRVLEGGKRLVVEDLAALGQNYRAAQKEVRRGAKCGVCVPVQQNGRNFALNFIFDQRPPDLESVADHVEELARKIRPVLARKLAEERIALLHSVVLHANDAVMVTQMSEPGASAAASRIIYANPALTRMSGYTLDELYGKPPCMLWGPQPEGALDGLHRAVARGEPARIELVCHRRNGSEYWTEISAVLVADELSGDRKLVAILRDTTERRRLEEALKERETKFRLLFANNPVPMWVYDVETARFLEVNNSAVEHYGYTREQFLAMAIDEIRPVEEVARLRLTPKAPLAPFGRLGVWRHRKADGSEILVDMAWHSLDFAGRQAAIVAAIDVTEQKSAEEETRRAKEAAEAASQAKSDLLANMSHELRTPLNAIIGFSEIMKTELFGPLGSAKYEGYVADIHDSAGHLLTVISDILDLAKIEANSFRLDDGIIDPSAVIASALRLVKPRADAAGVSVRYARQGASVALRADGTALKRILINLLSNAVKFSENGTSVVVRTEFDTFGSFAISVADQGIGMNADEIPVALTPFRQVNSGLQRKYEGTGLGLPIAKDLVELHGGSLLIESEVGRGTTVTVMLPEERVVPTAAVG